MSRIVLCIDNGNSCMEETKGFLLSHDCRVYTACEEKPDVGLLLEEIEQKEGRLDLLLFGVNEHMPGDGAIGQGHDCDRLLEAVSGEINRVQEAIEASLTLLRRGGLKRIGMITKTESSISYCKAETNYGEHMAWAGLNMVGKLYFNLLRPEGFTFRWYCAEENAGGNAGENAEENIGKNAGGNTRGMCAGEYLLSNLCYDAKEPYIHSEENRFVMRDTWLREVAW